MNSFRNGNPRSGKEHFDATLKRTTILPRRRTVAGCGRPQPSFQASRAPIKCHGISFLNSWAWKRIIYIRWVHRPKPEPPASPETGTGPAQHVGSLVEKQIPGAGGCPTGLLLTRPRLKFSSESEEHHAHTRNGRSDELPDTGCGYRCERLASPAFSYCTVATTLPGGLGAVGRTAGGLTFFTRVPTTCPVLSFVSALGWTSSSFGRISFGVG
jgi:hypothetical protein